ncbi:MAG: hypothetical protein K2X47_07705, partial [Bdellovibrionales bacterium]|nr:hypothetical protein [Bdellovibrionales bacterium]
MRREVIPRRKNIFVLLCFALNFTVIACQKNLAETWRAQGSFDGTGNREPQSDAQNRPLDSDEDAENPPQSENPSNGENPPQMGNPPA